MTYTLGSGEGLSPEALEEYRELELTLTVSDWVDFTLQNSWTGGVSGRAEPGFCSDGRGFVYLRGSMDSGTKTDGTTIATLPEELWPSFELPMHLHYNDSGPAYGELRITAAGELKIYGMSGGTSPVISLDGLIFQVGQ